MWLMLGRGQIPRAEESGKPVQYSTETLRGLGHNGLAMLCTNHHKNDIECLC